MGKSGKRIEIVTAKNSPSLLSDVFSPASRFGDLVFMAGQISVDPRTSQPIEGDVQAHIRRACENLKLALEDAGTSIDNILAMRFFLRDMEDYPTLAKIRREYFPKKPPTTTLAVAGIWPENKGCVEVDCIAVRDQ